MIKSYKQFENMDDPYGEERDDDLNVLDDHVGGDRSIKELIEELEFQGSLEIEDLTEEEYETIQDCLSNIMYKGLDLSEDFGIWEIMNEPHNVLVTIDPGDDHAQGWRIVYLQEAIENGNI